MHYREWAEWTGPSGFDAVCLFCDCSSAETNEILTHMTVCFMVVLSLGEYLCIIEYKILLKHVGAKQLSLNTAGTG